MVKVGLQFDKEFRLPEKISSKEYNVTRLL